MDTMAVPGHAGAIQLLPLASDVGEGLDPAVFELLILGEGVELSALFSGDNKDFSSPPLGWSDFAFRRK